MKQLNLKPLDLAIPDVNDIPGEGTHIWCCGRCNKLFRSRRGPTTPDAAPTARCPRCGWAWVLPKGKQE